jgi:hypothetical protein
MGRLSFIKRPKAIIPLVIAILLAAALVSAVRNLNSPAQGTVTQNNIDNAARINSGPQKYSDKYISFTYPGGFEVSPAEKGGSYVDVVNLISSQRRDRYAAIGVVRESLDSDSGVVYRRLHPELYKTVPAPAGSLVFAKDDNTEYTGFIEHAGQVISISFTSVAPRDMSGDYRTIAGSLAWKQ